MKKYSKLTTKGQIVIPQQIRESLSLKPGKKFKFSVHNGKEILLQPLISIEDAYGMIKSNKRSKKESDFKKAIKDRVIKKNK